MDERSRELERRYYADPTSENLAALLIERTKSEPFPCPGCGGRVPTPDMVRVVRQYPNGSQLVEKEPGLGDHDKVCALCGTRWWPDAASNALGLLRRAGLAPEEEDDLVIGAPNEGSKLGDSLTGEQF